MSLTHPKAPATDTSRPAVALFGSRAAAPVLVLAAAALWGTTGTAQALGHAQDPVAVGAARLAVGSVALLLLVALNSGHAWLVRCLRRPMLGWTLLGALATAVFQATLFSAVASTGVVTGTVVALGTAPVATGLCGAAWLHRAGQRGQLDGVDRTAGRRGAGSPGRGLLRLYTCAAKALLDREVPVLAALTSTLGLGAVVLTPVLTLRGPDLFGSGRSLLMVTWLGLATTAAAYVLFARGLRQLPAATVGTLSLFEPLTAAALGLLVLGERPGPRAVTGALCLLTGLLLVALDPRQAPPTPSLLTATLIEEVRA